MVRVAGLGGRSAKVTAVSRCVGRTMESIAEGVAGQVMIDLEKTDSVLPFLVEF